MSYYMYSGGTGGSSTQWNVTINGTVMLSPPASRTTTVNGTVMLSPPASHTKVFYYINTEHKEESFTLDMVEDIIRSSC